MRRTAYRCVRYLTPYRIPRDGPPTLTVDEMAPHISSLQARLIRWTHDVYQSTQPDTIERDYLQLAFLQATLLLHRPSPSFPLPSAEALDLCLSAARQIIQIAASAISRHLVNDLIPGWAGFYTLFMSGLTLMYCSWWVTFLGIEPASSCAKGRFILPKCGSRHRNRC